MGHERAVFNVSIVTGNVDCVFSGLRGPVTDIARAVVLVLTLDLGLGRSLNGKTWRPIRLSLNFHLLDKSQSSLIMGHTMSRFGEAVRGRFLLFGVNKTLAKAKLA